MLSEAIIIATSVNSEKIKILSVPEKIVVNPYFLEVLTSQFKVLRSPFFRKTYHFLVKLNFLILNQNSLLDEKVFFKNLLLAQRNFRERVLPSYMNEHVAEVFPKSDRPTVVFASRTDDYWNSLNIQRENRITIRNSDLIWTESLIKLLIINGFNVIRLGTSTNPKLDIVSTYFFDYSRSDFRSDENDFKICSLADIAVTTAGGISLLPSLLGIPGIVVNSGLFTDIQPQEYLHHYLPKSVFHKNGGSVLSATELAQLQLNTMQQDFSYDKQGLELREVSAEESFEAILDFYNTLKVKPLSSNSSKRKTDKFKSIPSEIRVQFPEDIIEQKTNLNISIKIHHLWRNF
jgi:putative glycosyltransferase (TIGR04372 family)